ncbi:MAG TPA: hypothetical protein VFY84_00020 [Jiangellales bacterium]|nr:hypothetical protein [Jiangellales bacterium]
MPAHYALASATLIVAGLAALSALTYAGIRPVRRVLRWPLLVTSSAACVLVFITADAGSTLLRTVEASASAAEVAAAQAHGHGSDSLTISIFFLFVTVLSTVWGALRPNRERWTVGMWTAALILAITAVATLVTSGVVVNAALDAVRLGTAG